MEDKQMSSTDLSNDVDDVGGSWLEPMRTGGQTATEA